MLIHGFGTSSFLWRNIAPEIALANRTAFAIDLFGYGESDRPFDADFGIAAQAELVDRALTALRLPKATVVGVDLGGCVALRLASSRPERVERLLLINPIALDEIPAFVCVLAGAELRVVLASPRPGSSANGKAVEGWLAEDLLELCERLNPLRGALRAPVDFFNITRLSVESLGKFFTPGGISDFASQVGQLTGHEARGCDLETGPRCAA